MIAIQLKGGLGNQLFQYATARAWALRKNELLYLDLSLLMQRNTGNFFFLDEFKIKAKTNSNYFERWWFHNFTKKKLDLFTENPGIENLLPPDNIYLQGYWQNRSYFDDIRELLIAEIRPKAIMSTSLLSEIKKTESVAIHFRRGDYLGHPLHDICTERYFFNAIEFMRSKIKEPSFFVFSDEIEYCKNILGSVKDLIFVDEKNTVPAFWLMKNCRHFILSNSSFGWWAQYLNRDKKIVTAPPRWFNDSKIKTNGIYFPHWKIIETV